MGWGVSGGDESNENGGTEEDPSFLYQCRHPRMSYTFFFSLSCFNKIKATSRQLRVWPRGRTHTFATKKKRYFNIWRYPKLVKNGKNGKNGRNFGGFFRGKKG